MAVAILDNPDAGGSDHGVGTAATTNTVSVTLSSGTNRALVACIVWNNGGGETISSVVWDPTGANQSLTAIATEPQQGQSLACSIWGLVGYTPGTSKNLTVTFSSAVTSYLAPITYTGVDQTGGTTTFRNAATNLGGSATASSGAITSATGDMVVGACAGANGFITPSGTGIFNENSIGIGGGANTDNGAATVTLTFTLTSGNWGYAACDIKAAGGAASPTLQKDFPNPTRTDWYRSAEVIPQIPKTVSVLMGQVIL